MNYKQQQKLSFDFVDKDDDGEFSNNLIVVIIIIIIIICVAVFVKSKLSDKKKDVVQPLTNEERENLRNQRYEILMKNLHKEKEGKKHDDNNSQIVMKEKSKRKDVPKNNNNRVSSLTSRKNKDPTIIKKKTLSSLIIHAANPTTIVPTSEEKGKLQNQRYQETLISTANNRTTTTTKKSHHPEIGQVLSEVLSFVTKHAISVMIIRNDDNNADDDDSTNNNNKKNNGNVYQPRTKLLYKKKKKIIICISYDNNNNNNNSPSSFSFSPHNNTNQNNEDGTSKKKRDTVVVLRPTDIFEAASWHNVLCNVRRYGHSHYLTPEDPNFRVYQNFLDQFMKDILQHVIIKWVVNDDDSEDDSDDEEDDDDEEDLFTDYIATKSSSSEKKNEQGRDLFCLAEQVPPVANPKFWDDLLLYQQQQQSSSSSKNLSSLPKRILNHYLRRLDDKRAIGFSTLLRQSTICAKVFAERIIQNEVVLFANESTSINGKEIEQKSLLRLLFQEGASSVPKLGSELATTTSSNTTAENNKKSRFQKKLETLVGFPTCIFRYDQKFNKARTIFYDQCHQESRMIRDASEVALKKGGKDIFKWLKHIIRANDAMGYLLKNELLSAVGPSSVCSSRSFLLGLGIALLGVCCDKMEERFRQKGGQSFDNQYLHNLETDGELMLIRTSHHSSSDTNDNNTINSNDGARQTTFTGMTEFFFLAAALLRISLYPAMQMELELQRDQRARNLFDLIRQAARKEEANNTTARTGETTAIPPRLMPMAKQLVTAYVGWNVFFQDPIVLERMTKFTILQLQWLITILRDDKDQHILMNKVPEWMCKQPALWLSHVASVSPYTLRPQQATISVECATELLQIGTNTSKGRVFSPVVVDDLVKIIVSFVNAGVRRAKGKERRRQRRSSGRLFGSSTDNEVELDDRNLDVYLSFDRNDLGVTVFTNERVCNDLCPTLIKTFGTFDIVEGLDVDKEHGFDKYSARFRVAELFLILWSHPNGRCRQSIIKMKDTVLADFVKEVILAIGTMFDFGCDRLAEACDTRRQSIISRRDRAKLFAIEKGISSNFRCARLWTRLLLQLSKEPRIRKALGELPGTQQNLASLIIHFIDVLTEEDGGIKTSIDVSTKRSADMYKESKEKRKDAMTLLRNRWYTREVYGLDVSTFCHQFLALLASWHKEAKGSDGTSPILKAFATNQDFEIYRYQNIFRRLLTHRLLISTLDNPGNIELIFHHDGYIDTKNWDNKLRNDLPNKAEVENQLRASKSNRMNFEEIAEVASNKEITNFLNVAESIRKQQEDDFRKSVIAEEMIDETVAEILHSGELAADEVSYGQKLNDWLVSSDSFMSKHDSKSFAHYYDSIARNRSVTASAKRLIKEAHRCHKELPTPHPNTAAFVCFAEERMDICRACITGPVDSPYSLGIFIFDVFFPSNYPNIPPLMTFMTTGGGQTRFNPNLYSDGKVCVSLLGTFHASDESQKWNPKYSSLAQVLLSVQTQLLVEEPYFNEPGTEALRGTSSGNTRSEQYNLTLRLATLRFAIIDQIKNPPVGFEDVVALHFAICRRRVLVQAKRWMIEAKSTNIYHRFKKAYQELVTLFSSMNIIDIPALPPLESDLQTLPQDDIALKELKKSTKNKPLLQKINLSTATSEQDMTPP